MMVMSLAISCNKDRDCDGNEFPDGGIEYRDIYIMADDIPVDAQNYVLTIPAEAGEYDVQLLVKGYITLDVLNGCEGIEISTDSNWQNVPEDAGKNGYKETMHIKAEANNSKLSRNLNFCVIAHVFNGFRADMTIVQQGK